MNRKQELMKMFMDKELTTEDLINMIVKLEGSIEVAIGFTDYEWDSQWNQLQVIKETLEQ